MKIFLVMARQAGEITPATGKIIKQNNNHTMRTKNQHHTHVITVIFLYSGLEYVIKITQRCSDFNHHLTTRWLLDG